MLTIRKSKDRGHRDHGWLFARHSFSFGDYRDETNMGFSDLRVLNDDIVQPNHGFAKHPHRDMEIITYVLSGELTHEDSMGHASTIKPGDIQVMSAGRGVYHVEKNDSAVEPLHLMQIWILPEEKGLAPRYAEKKFSDEEKRGKLRLIVSRDGAEDSLTIAQDAKIFAALLDGEEKVAYGLSADRAAYVQVVRGTLNLNGTRLWAGDGVRIEDETALHFENGDDAEILLFDLRSH
jgi:redox-sensitive bicupin YhaK (pirin superfamily)